MAILKKLYQIFKGLDLRTSDILRDDNSATVMDNSAYRQTGGMSKRSGFRYTAGRDVGGYGTHTYTNSAITTGISTDELLTVDNHLHKLVENTFTITYSGSYPTTTYYTFLYDTTVGTFYFRIYENGSLIYEKSCLTGREDSTIIPTISDLTTAINGLANFSCPAASGGTTQYACTIPTTKKEYINTTATITFETLDQVDIPPEISENSNTSDFVPFSNAYAQRTSAEFENASFTQINGVLYIANGFDVLTKYDGNRVYKAGLPSPDDQLSNFSVNTYSGTGTGWQTTDKRNYLMVYEYTDAKGNIITGKHAIDEEVAPTVNDRNMLMTLPYMNRLNSGAASKAGCGYNLVSGTFNGTQNNVNDIVVTNASDLKVGDYIYFQDFDTVFVPSNYISRQITAINSNTITIDGDPVDVINLDYYSTIKMSVYRTTDFSAAGTPGLYYLIQEYCNLMPDEDSTLYKVIADSRSDADIVGYAQWVEPVKEHGLPPIGKYIESWRGQLLISGIPTQVNKIAYSDIDSPEYYPSADNSFLLDRKVTGIKVLDNVLYAFKERSIDGITGDLGDDNFQVDSLNREGIGCEANATIQEVQGKLFFLSKSGVYAIDRDGVADVGAPISPDFTINKNFDYKKATAFTWQADDKYVLFMPNIDTSTDNANNATSATYVFDYFRLAWSKWQNYNLLGGMTEYNDQIYKFSREDLNASSINWLHKIRQEGDKYDYADHHESISWAFGSPWLSIGEPAIKKKFLRCTVHSYDATLEDFESDTFTLTASTNHDYDPSRDFSNITYDFGTETDGWGESAWGITPFGYERLNQLKRRLASKSVKSLRLNLSNDTMYENVLISGIELEVATPYKVEGGLKD